MPTTTTTTATAMTPRDVLAAHRLLFEQKVSSGSATPWLFPQGVLGLAALVAYLLVPIESRWNADLVRYGVFAFLFANHAWVICNFTNSSAPGGFMIGYVYSWLTIWAAHLILFNDAKRDFRRIESRSFLRKQLEKHRLTELPAGGTEYFWQSFPSSAPMSVRLSWVSDLLGASRGVGWNFQTSWVPDVPARVQKQLRESSAKEGSSATHAPEEAGGGGGGGTGAVSRTGVRRYDDRQSVLAHALWTLVVSYVVLDLFKTVMAHDRYFYGDLDAALPEYWPKVMRQSWILTRFYRVMISGASLQLVMRCMFSAAVVVFVGLGGPGRFGVRGEAWLYPEQWGSVRHIGDLGVAGYWGGHWHQMLRVGLQSLAFGSLKAVGVSSKGVVGSYAIPFIVFFWSGVVHMCSSYTTVAETRWWDALLFFVLQPVAMVAEAMAGRMLGGMQVVQRMPRWCKRTVNVGWCLLWIFATGPLLVEDFSRGGAWVVEPFFFVSPFRGLGLGMAQDGWMNGDYFSCAQPRWHSDARGRWWLTGFTL